VRARRGLLGAAAFFTGAGPASHSVDVGGDAEALEVMGRESVSRWAGGEKCHE
jgi:hypothetical protein